MKDIVKVLKALSDENRLRIIKMLEKRDICVCEFQEVLGLSQPAVSHHLKVLGNAGVVDYRKEGLFVSYRLAEEEGEPHGELISVLLRLLGSERVPEHDLEHLSAVDRASLSKKGR